MHFFVGHPKLPLVVRTKIVLLAGINKIMNPRCPWSSLKRNVLIKLESVPNFTSKTTEFGIASR